MNILVIDVGGSNVKLLMKGRRLKFPSGPTLTANEMVEEALRLTAQWKYEAVTIGFPGPVENGKPVAEPENLGNSWLKFDFEGAFGVPVIIINDAVLQALGSYRGGKMLFLGLGTGLGSTFIAHNVIVPLELGCLLNADGKAFVESVGKKGLTRLGPKKWRQQIGKMLDVLNQAFRTDYIVLGGGNADKMGRLPKNVRRGSNRYAYPGGVRLWETEPLSPDHLRHKWLVT